MEVNLLEAFVKRKQLEKVEIGAALPLEAACPTSRSPLYLRGL